MIGEIFEIKKDFWLKAQEEFFTQAADFTAGTKDRVINSRYVAAYRTELTPEAQTAAIFNNRLARTYPLNLTEPILLQHQAACAQPMTVEGFDDAEIMQDVTGYGENFQDAFSWRLWRFFEFGLVGTLVEGPAQVAATKEGAYGERSYQTIFPAPDIIQLKLWDKGERKGEVERVVLREMPVVRDSLCYERRRLYFYTAGASYYTWQIAESIDGARPGGAATAGQFKVIDEGEGTLSRIPFVPIGCGVDDSAIKDVVGLNQALINRLSVWSNINYHQGFQRTVFGNIRDASSFKNVGEYQAWATSDDVTVKTIDAGKSESNEAEIKLLIRLIHQIGLLKFNELMEDTREVQSAEAKAKDLQARAHYYNDVLNVFERKEALIYELHAELEGAPADVSVQIGREFGLEDEEGSIIRDQVLFQWVSDLDDASALAIKKALIRERVRCLDLEQEEKDALLKQLEAAQLKQQRAMVEPFSLMNRLEPEEEQPPV